MISQLTIQQKKLKKTIKDKWIAALTIPHEKIDKNKIVKMIELAYSLAKIDKPKIIILRSPMAIQIAANLFRRQEVGREVGQEVRQEVEREVRQEKLKFYNFGYYLSAWYYDWFSFYDYFITAGIIKNNRKFETLKIGMENGIYETIQLEGLCLVSLTPISVFKKNNRLHSDKFPAVKFADSYSVYALNGVRFPKELWKKIVSREMAMEDILKIQDIDQRTQAIKYAKNGLRDFYKQQKGRKIDEIDKLDIKGRKVHYELWKIPKGNIFSQEVAFVIYDCPSSIERGNKQEYTKGVPVEFNKTAEAIAWGMSSDENQISPEDWQNLIPLLHES